jgi:hypothetical protein
MSVAIQERMSNEKRRAKDPSIADTFISIPDSPFFLRHVVAINYGGKIYSVLRGVEVALTTDDTVEQILLILYAVFMVLGTYWYTRFWQKDEDIESYYTDGSAHILSQCSNIAITLGAACYYLIFAILFGLSYNSTKTPTCFSLALWNAWCCANLLLATPWRKK